MGLLLHCNAYRDNIANSIFNHINTQKFFLLLDQL